MAAETTVKSEVVLIGARRFLFLILTVALTIITALFAFSWLVACIRSDDKILALAGTAIVGLAIANPIARWLLLPRMRRPIMRSPREGLRVAVVTTYVPESESLDMLEATLRAMKRMDYPHDCWMLDEGDREEAIDLCRRLGVSHFSRKGRPAYQAKSGTFQSRSKHGNYNAWLVEIGFHEYDVVAAFDPDHIPAAAFLTETLGYFDDESVGYVQAAQAYYNQKASFIAAGAAEETYDYYSTLQMAGYGMGFPIVIGSHNVHRVTALREVGGFAPHDADDLLITLFYREKRWTGVYVPAILARGLVPVDWQGYLTQQRRWARSVLDIKFRLQPSLAKRLPKASKVASYLHGLSYLQPAIMLLLTIAFVLKLLIRGDIPTSFADLNVASAAAMGALLIACLFFRQNFFLDPKREWGFHWRARLLRVAKAPFLLLALADVVSARRFEYVMTPKTRQPKRRNLLLVPFGLIALLVVTAWMFGMARQPLYNPVLSVLAGTLLTFCGGLIGSRNVCTPEPFDRRLASGMIEGRDGQVL